MTSLRALLISGFVVLLLLSASTLLAAIYSTNQGLWAAATLIFHAALIYVGVLLARAMRR